MMPVSASTLIALEKYKLAMKIAEVKELVCERCGEPAPLSEETGRYLTGYCGICGHFFDKIMSE